MAAAPGLTTRRWLPALTVAAALASVGWGKAADAPLDAYARAVVDSVAHPPPSTPRELLEAATKTAAVEAFEVATGYVKQLADALADAGDARSGLLGELGDDADPVGLDRLETMLAARAPDLVPVVEALRETARVRRHDPGRLARAAADLRSRSYATRIAATTTLGRGGIDALPVLVGVLGAEDAAGERARAIARGLVRDLGPDATRTLLDRLGSADLASWPGVIAALDAVESDDIAEFLLAPAVVPGTPPAIRDRALHALLHLHRRCSDPNVEWRPPTRGEAEARIVRRLDHVLSPAWFPDAGQGDDTARSRRAREALHLARDLSAIGATDPAAVRLVLLARLEASVLQFGAADLGPEQLAAVLTGPEGTDLEAIADVLDLATSRGMFTAAAAAARGLEEAVLPADRPLDAPSAALPPTVRSALVRSLAVPEAALQFAAARTLALAAGPPPWPGSSRVVETLVHAATAAGTEHVVVAHHDAEIAHEIAAGVSRFGYRPVRVSTGRAALLAAREHADTTLVILGARIIRPSAFETAQFIQEQPHGDIPPVLIVIDPLDDEARGRFLTKAIMLFAGLPCTALIDRTESLFLPVLDETTGQEVAPARFPALVAEVAGAEASSANARAARAATRLERGRQAAVLLAILDRRGWDVPAATRARLGLASAGRFPPGYNRAALTPSPPLPDDAALLHSAR